MPTGLDKKVARNVQFDEDIIKKNTFDLEEVLIKATSEENLISEGMLDMRVGYRNQKFLEGFVGVCIWKHMNNNDCWARPSSFDPFRNEENPAIFTYHIDCLRKKHTVLWKKVSDHGVNQIDYSKLHNFCHNIKSRYKKSGCWNEKSSEKNGVYEKYHEMLKNFDFPFE